MDGGSSTADSDDLEIVKVTEKFLEDGQHLKLKSKPVGKRQHQPLQPTKRPKRSNKEVEFDTKAQDSESLTAKVEWTEDEFDGFESTSKKFKPSKRKRSGRKPKEAKAGESKRRRLDYNHHVDSSNTSGSDRSEAEDNNDVPDYIQKRRVNFDERTQTLKQGGLKLPPSYEDINFSDDERLDNLEERPDFLNLKPTAEYKDKELHASLGLIPAPIAQWLRDYQVQGAAFLHKLFVYQQGGILGDDMGLGKTIQVIAFLTAAFGKTGDARDKKRMRKMRRARRLWYPRILIVCPGTLIENWRSELERWGWWHVDCFHGPGKEEALKAAAAGNSEILITTYTTYRTNKDTINFVEWDAVIADECHSIKGRSSETTKAMNEVNALCRIGLTGTAIQNSYDELWALLNWTNPGKFGPISTWKKTISEPLKIGQSHEATMHQLGTARKTAKALVENLLPPFLLRRMKTLIARQLPKKTDRVVFCPLTEIQAEAYETLLKSNMIEYIRTSSDDCDCGSGKKSGWCCRQLLNDAKWQSYIFPAIVALQKLANHIAILIPRGTDPKDKQEKDLLMLQTVCPDGWRGMYRSRGALENFANTEFCGKWKVLKKLLKFWHENGDKVLVFSHSVRLLEMLRILFQNTSYNVSFLDGSMAYEDRAKEVNNFNSDSSQFVFLISTKAGGVGLNITSANKVVIMDPNWNPAYDLQAQDRAYRIGQSRDVEVFRLISSGTIEEIVYARQIYKQQQANIGYTASNERRYFKGVQSSTSQKGEIFGLANLFAYAGDQLVLRNIVNKTNVAESRAGVSVLDIGVDPAGGSDENDSPIVDNEDSAMSQLAALIANGDADSPNADLTSQNSTGSKKAQGKKQKRKLATKSDPVQAILAGAGVEYTHENSEVIGTSRVEAHLSRKAEEGGWDLDLGEKQVFADTQSQSQSQRRARLQVELSDKPLPDNGASEDESDDSQDLENGVGAEGSEWVPEYEYKPPAEVQKRQFCTMAKTFGYEDAVEFALAVEGWTQEERRNCLDRFYARRRKELARGTAAGAGGEGQVLGTKESTGEKADVNGEDLKAEVRGKQDGWDDSW
ncbi:hypothetical protein MMC10_001871 [Thelotrema lepadinum]|nr:hypothetical protein [Thelotrema lepadinum]